MIAANPVLLASFTTKDDPKKLKVGLVDKAAHKIIDITGADGIKSLDQILNWVNRVAKIRALNTESLKKYEESEITLKAPIPTTMPVWAAGVTYDVSRMERGKEQSVMQFRQPRAQLTRPDNKTTAYDLVYAQDPENGRPEIFFKAQPGTAVGTKQAIGIRADSEADVPEGELILVLNDKGDLVGYTMGNDVSSRDIEGQNPLYLPQAKVYANSAAIGPYIELLDDSNTEQKIKAEPNSGGWKVNMKVIRSGQEAYAGETVIAGIKNTFANLITNLRKSQHMPHGAALFTGTGIIPPMDFRLQEGDIVKISIGNLGTLENVVKKLPDGPVVKKDLDAYAQYAAEQTWAAAV